MTRTGSETSGRSRPRTVRLLVAVLAVMATAAFYLLLIDTTALPELLAGAGITLLAAAVLDASVDRNAQLLRSPVRWAVELGRAITRVPRDVFTLAILALRQAVSPADSVGRLLTRACDAADEGDRARHEFLGSLSPGEIVIGHEAGDACERVHRLGLRR